MFNKFQLSSTMIYQQEKNPTFIELVDLEDLEERELQLTLSLQEMHPS